MAMANLASIILLCMLFSFLILSICLPPVSCLQSSPPTSNNEGYVVEGRVKMQALAGKGVSKTSNIKVVLNGGQKLSFVRSDGSFAFQGVPAGTHLLEVVALGYFFSPVRVDVSSRLQGQVRASLVETGRSLPDSLVLEPLREEYYYEKREPFSAMGLLKSPMGLMIGFMVVCVFLLPKLMDQIDPEEMKRVQEEMRNKPSPLSNLLQGRT
ncbi:hypothetical protein CY35_04G143000 [Sphagnum magellanicum]|nr:hypothetical protein CY35_04G143000 [Sphagnum magellanicum]KAH9566709.1 hypothetical protein CY35_04G143000 [Sphagnum magellanicum]KAH9566710.1 hypothetical protein CY35_04G143000 [Sphagnum magellanicum]